MIRPGFVYGGTKGLIFTEASLRDGFVAPGLKLAAFPEHRLIHRRKASTRPTLSRVSP